jgi:hypothetical protein
MGLSVFTRNGTIRQGTVGGAILINEEIMSLSTGHWTTGDLELSNRITSSEFTYGDIELVGWSHNVHLGRPRHAPIKEVVPGMDWMLIRAKQRFRQPNMYTISDSGVHKYVEEYAERKEMSSGVVQIIGGVTDTRVGRMNMNPFTLIHQRTKFRLFRIAVASSLGMYT